MEEIKKDLVSLRLKGVADNLEFRISQAEASGSSFIDFIRGVIEDEKVRRERKRYEKRLLASDLKPLKTLENYDFALQPTINRDLVMQLAKCDFIKKRDKIIAMGVSGIGKSHIINGIGLFAIEKGFIVLRYCSNELADKLLLARKEKTYNELISKITKADFVILDEFSMRPCCEGGMDELFALMEKLDESVSVAITSNRDFKDWNTYFSDNTIASAFTDRAINNAILIKVEAGTSERQKNFERKNLRPGEDGPDSK